MHVPDPTEIRNLLASESEGTGKPRIQQDHGVQDGGCDLYVTCN